MKIREKRRRLYFLKQKVIGIFILVLTILAVKLLDGDATFALLTVPLVLVLIFSKEKLWMDDYCFEEEVNDRVVNDILQFVNSYGVDEKSLQNQFADDYPLPLI